MGDRAYFVSDIHLENMQERNGQILLRFLHSLATQENPPDLYFLGDIFDLWLSGHKVFIKKFEPLFEPLRMLKSKGSRLVYFEGNHDLHLHPFWQKKLGFELFEEAQYFKIGDLTVRLEHGDQMNPNDIAYRRWRAFTRNPIVEFLAHALPGIFWNSLGEKMSQKSRKTSRQYRSRNEEPIRSMIREHAIVEHQKKPFDLIISGHMHVKFDEVFQTPSGIVRNINLGSWLEDENPEVLVIEKSNVKWISLK
jgi:UDP-2,3-diacylglucosamine hydrolase